MKRPFEVYFLKSCKSGGMGGMVWQKQAKRPNTMPPLFLGGMGWYGVNHLYIFCKTYFLVTMPPCHPCHLFLKKFVKTASEIKNLLKNRWRVARNCVRIATQKPLHFLILSLWDMPGIGPKKKAQTAMGLSLFFHFLTGQRIT